MELIDKDALVAEIEKLELCTMDEHMNYYSAEAQGEYNALSKLESFIDTLEVKEVDLEKEIASQYESNYEDYLIYEEFADIAKYFFKLGMQQAKKGK